MYSSKENDMCRESIEEDEICEDENIDCVDETSTVLFTLFSTCFWGGIFRQEIVVVNEIVLQCTKILFFLTENFPHEVKNYRHLPFY